jgi:predicted enzyme related to lactoylglutathione lyase
MTMNPVVHFEMPAEDRERMKNFYAKAFGWQYIQLGSEMGNYTIVMTTESDQNGPFKPGMINGGFFDKTKDNQYPSVVISVDNIEEAAKKVTEAGGKVLGGIKGDGTPDPIPGVGLYSLVIDSEGNRVGMLQPEPRQGAKT